MGCPVRLSAARLRLLAHRFFFPFNRPIMSLLSLLNRIHFIPSHSRHLRFISRLISPSTQRVDRRHPGQSFQSVFDGFFSYSVLRFTFVGSSPATTHPTPRTRIPACPARHTDRPVTTLRQALRPANADADERGCRRTGTHQANDLRPQSSTPPIDRASATSRTSARYARSAMDSQDRCAAGECLPAIARSETRGW